MKFTSIAVSVLISILSASAMPIGNGGTNGINKVWQIVTSDKLKLK